MERLWAPWRLEYLESADDATDCVFCSAASPAGENVDSLLIYRGSSAVVMLNKYPYAPAIS